MTLRYSIVFHVVLLAMLVFLFIISLGLQLQRVIFPLMVLGIGILASLLKLAALFRPQWRMLLDPEGMFEGMGKAAVSSVAAKVEVDEDTGLVPSAPQHKLTLASMVLWIVITMAGIILFGFPVGTGVSTLVYMAVLSHEKWIPSLATAVLLAISLHLVFTVALEVEPYAGLLFG